MKIAILGNSGSGKSTLAGRLAAAHAVPVLDLDTVAWEPGQIAVPRPADAQRADVTAFCRARDEWIVEGCYAALVEVALGEGATLVFLDLPVEDCVAHCRARPWEPHKYPSKQAQDDKLEFLLGWVRDYDTRDGDMSRARHRAVFDAYEGPKQRLVCAPGPDYRPPPAGARRTEA